MEYELKSLTRMYNELTNTYSDIIRKYNLLEQGIDAEFVKFENESNKRILLLKEKLNNKISALKKTCDEQVDEIRTIYDEKLKTLSDNKSFILEEIFILKRK